MIPACARPHDRVTPVCARPHIWGQSTPGIHPPPVKADCSPQIQDCSLPQHYQFPMTQFRTGRGPAQMDPEACQCSDNRRLTPCCRFPMTKPPDPADPGFQSGPDRCHQRKLPVPDLYCSPRLRTINSQNPTYSLCFRPKTVRSYSVLCGCHRCNLTYRFLSDGEGLDRQGDGPPAVFTRTIPCFLKISYADPSSNNQSFRSFLKS